MREWLTVVTEYTTLLIDSLALLVIVVGTLEAFVNGLRVMLSSGSGHVKRDVWLRYARWLVVGLTFQKVVEERPYDGDRGEPPDRLPARADRGLDDVRGQLEG